jgi:hypothetical protein
MTPIKSVLGRDLRGNQDLLNPNDSVSASVFEFGHAALINAFSDMGWVGYDDLILVNDAWDEGYKTILSCEEGPLDWPMQLGETLQKWLNPGCLTFEPYNSWSIVIFPDELQRGGKARMFEHD